MAATGTDPQQRRSKGEQTRLGILEATLCVIAKQGLRGVTHRAVASEAEVQLSLTTYYFKDIDELISEAFALFCERSRPGYDALWSNVFLYLDEYPASQLRKASVREDICSVLSEHAADYLIHQVKNKPEGLAVEQVFFTSVRLTPALRELALQHRRNLLAPLVKLCEFFNKADPHIDADLLLDTVTRLEYNAPTQEPDSIDRDNIESLLRRQIGWALGLKSA